MELAVYMGPPLYGLRPSTNMFSKRFRTLTVKHVECKIEEKFTHWVKDSKKNLFDKLICFDKAIIDNLDFCML